MKNKVQIINIAGTKAKGVDKSFGKRIMVGM
jgi:hypothetical protein